MNSPHTHIQFCDYMIGAALLLGGAGILFAFRRITSSDTVHTLITIIALATYISAILTCLAKRRPYVAVGLVTAAGGWLLIALALFMRHHWV